MLRQRPVLANAGAVACLGLLTGLAGCGTGAVAISSPALSGRDAAACRTLVRALPATVSDQKQRQVQPPDAYGAAWGDPPIVLRCGVGKPAGFDKFSSCQVTNGVGWFIPEEQITGRPNDIVMTTVGRAQYVEVRVPADYFPPAATMVDLAPAIKSSIHEVRPCL
jgi:hypothetical protein